jgi:hypothetical protein
MVENIGMVVQERMAGTRAVGRSFRLPANTNAQNWLERMRQLSRPLSANFTMPLTPNPAIIATRVMSQ